MSVFDSTERPLATKAGLSWSLRRASSAVGPDGDGDDGSTVAVAEATGAAAGSDTRIVTMGRCLWNLTVVLCS